MNRTALKRRLLDRIADIANEIGDDICLTKIPIDKRGPILEAAFTLGPTDDAIRRAFDATNLNPENPFCWHALLSAYSQMLFPERKPAGRTKKWTSAALCTLLSDARQLQNKYASISLSDVALSRVLRRDFKDKYGSMSVEVLRKQLAAARKTQDNRVLFACLSWQPKAKRRMSQKIRDQVIAAFIDDIAEGWTGWAKS